MKHEVTKGKKNRREGIYFSYSSEKNIPEDYRELYKRRFVDIKRRLVMRIDSCNYGGQEGVPYAICNLEAGKPVV